MKRLIDFALSQWKNNTYDRRALLLRGARQVGKTYAVREFGKSFEYFVEINLEKHPEVATIFRGNLDPKRLIKELTEHLNQYCGQFLKAALSTVIISPIWFDRLTMSGEEAVTPACPSTCPS